MAEPVYATVGRAVRRPSRLLAPVSTGRPLSMVFEACNSDGSYDSDGSESDDEAPGLPERIYSLERIRALARDLPPTVWTPVWTPSTSPDRKEAAKKMEMLREEQEHILSLLAQDPEPTTVPSTLEAPASLTTPETDCRVTLRLPQVVSPIVFNLDASLETHVTPLPSPSPSPRNLDEDGFIVLTPTKVTIGLPGMGGLSGDSVVDSDTDGGNWGTSPASRFAVPAPPDFQRHTRRHNSFRMLGPKTSDPANVCEYILGRNE